MRSRKPDTYCTGEVLPLEIGATDEILMNRFRDLQQKLAAYVVDPTSASQTQVKKWLGAFEQIKREGLRRGLLEER